MSAWEDDMATAAVGGDKLLRRTRIKLLAKRVGLLLACWHLCKAIRSVLVHQPEARRWRWWW